MTDEQIALARRAVACRGWRWMPGMADCWGGRVREGDGLDRATAFPDLTDPATLGCLLALVREAHGQTTLSPVNGGKRCWFLADFGTTALQGESEAELLVAALEAAP
jgi:hypothetical protein